MRKLAIMGASYLQAPLIEKAKKMNLETHVFAWAANDVGEKIADYFYPISIVEKDKIAQKCEEIGIDGICTIASDLAVVTVNYVAEQLGLNANSLECTRLSTNKHAMRIAFEKNGDPSPKSRVVESVLDIDRNQLRYPLIVKPLDRSGSRGITKVTTWDQLVEAINIAKQEGFEKKALIEEFVSGKEYSVETISWEGQHHFLAITEKFTTGHPHFIETGHVEPAMLNDEMTEKIKKVVNHALDSLMVTMGASHSELKIDDYGNIWLIEIGGRMGGDYIGSHLVDMSTGIDYIENVIHIALGKEPNFVRRHLPYAAAVRFVLNQEDIDVLHRIQMEHPEYLQIVNVKENMNGEVTDSSTRLGVYVMKAPERELLQEYLPKEGVE